MEVPSIDAAAVSEQADTDQSVESRRSISTRLLLAVNGICLVLLLLFFVHDHRQETKRRFSDKRIALQEEAVIMLVAVHDIQHHGIAVLQQFVDRTCAQMEEVHSRGHHVVLRIGDHVVEADSGHRASGDMQQALESAAAAPGHRGWHQDSELIAGVASDAGLSIYVSEFVDDVRREIVGDSFRRLGSSLVLAVVAAIVVNVVLLRVVVGPVERLVGIVEEIGRGNFHQHVSSFQSRELSFLSRAINRMSQSLADSQRYRRWELDKARRIQQNLLPEFHDLSGAKFAVHYEPADDVAGDFYDVRHLADGSWGILMADVTGHGIPGAMNATLLKTHFAEGCERFSDILDIARHVNRRFVSLTLPEDLATAILIRFVPESRTMQVVNAGHDAGLLRFADGNMHECRSSGLLMGIDRDADWTMDEWTVSPGDRLLLFTDGITESLSPDRRMFGRERVVALLNRTIDKVPAAALASLVQEVEAFRGDDRQSDDVTAILINF